MENEEDKILKRHYKYLDSSWKAAFYSIQRIDLLIISISGAGIYACLEIFQYIHKEKICADLCFLKLIGFLFTAAIILNFISQFSGYKSNFHSFLKADHEIDQIESQTNHKKEISKLDCYISIYDKITQTLNVISAVVMIISLIGLTIFIWVSL